MSQRCWEREQKYGVSRKGNEVQKGAMEPNAFRGEIVARTGLLIGGQKVHQSHGFEEWKDCVRWCDTVIKINKEAGRDPMYNGIRMVYCKNPITHKEIAGED